MAVATAETLAWYPTVNSATAFKSISHFGWAFAYFLLLHCHRKASVFFLLFDLAGGFDFVVRSSEILFRLRLDLESGDA